jgi:cytidine deaminase
MNVTLENMQRLVAAASAVRDRAYAPYSRFRVGAALLLADGSIITGCNVENASFGLTVCAERNAVAAAVAAGITSFVAIAVVSDTSPPATPCGACRQVLSEFGDMPVILANTAGARKITSVADLLPDSFDGSVLSNR